MMKSLRSRSNSSSRSTAALRSDRRCEVCRRLLALRALTIVRDDQGQHELCAPCEEVYSLNTMKYFARDIAAHGEALALMEVR